MSKCSCYIAVQYAILSVLIAGCTTPDSDHARIPVQRLEVQSPSGKYQFVSVPSRRDGQGSSECRLSFENEVVWEKSLEFTLYDAVVNDAGRVAGYGYNRGREARDTPGDILLALLDSDGRVAKLDRVPRSKSPYMHSFANPIVWQIVHNNYQERVLFRVSSRHESQSAQENWRTYSLQSFQQLNSLEVEHSSSIFTILHVPETRFYIAQHWAQSTPTRSVGAIYNLFDEKGNIVWTLDKTSDFWMGPTEIPHQEYRRLEELPAISCSEVPRQFSIEFVQDAQRVTFEVSDFGVVRETGRRDSDWTSKPRKCQIEIDQGKFQTLAELGEVSLGAKQDFARSIRGILSFDMNSSDQLGFIRNEPVKPDTFVLIDLQGNVLLEQKLDLDELPHARWSGVAAAGGESFVIVQSQVGEGAKSRAWRIDHRRKSAVRLSEFDSSAIDCISCFPDGSFAVLTYYPSAVQCHEADGKLRWRRESNESSFLLPKSLCVSSGGQILVLDQGSNKVWFIGADNSLQSTHRLEENGNLNLNYASDITHTSNGGYCIYDFSGQPSLILFDSAGDVVQSMSCKLSTDLDELYPLDGPKVSSNGDLWITDGEAFYTVATNGIAKLRFPIVPQNTMTTIDSITVSRERIYAQSKLNGAVHVFDLEGVPLHALSHRKLANQTTSFKPIQLLPQQEVMVIYSDEDQESRWLLFSSEGRLLGEKNFGETDVTPISRERFIEHHFNRLRLVDAAGWTLEEIERQPNGDWLGNGLNVSVSDQGSFAVLMTQPKWPGDWSKTICIFSADGEPLGTIPFGKCGIDNFDFDGQHIAVSMGRNVYVYTKKGEPLYQAEWPVRNGQDCWITPKLIAKQGRLFLLESNFDNHAIRLFEMPK